MPICKRVKIVGSILQCAHQKRPEGAIECLKLRCLATQLRYSCRELFLHTTNLCLFFDSQYFLRFSLELSREYHQRRYFVSNVII